MAQPRIAAGTALDVHKLLPVNAFSFGGYL